MSRAKESNILSRLFQVWMCKVVERASNPKITSDELILLEDDLCQRMSQKFSSIIRPSHEPSSKQNQNIFFAFIRQYLPKFAFHLILVVIYTFLGLLIPVITREFVAYFENGQQESGKYVALLISAILFGGIISIIIRLHYLDMQKNFGVHLVSAVNSAIYAKILRQSKVSWTQVEDGQVINLLSIDSSRFIDLLNWFDSFYWGPIYLTASIYLLYQEMGTAVIFSTFAALGWSILIFPLNRAYKKWMTKKMSLSDKRIRLLQEILDGIKVIKLHCWEEPFAEQILSTRSAESRVLSICAAWQGLLSCQGTLIMLIFNVTTFIAYHLIKKEPILASKIFFVLALSKYFSHALNCFIEVLIRLSLSIIAGNRINKFLRMKESPVQIKREASSSAITVKSASFAWKHDQLNESSNGLTTDELSRNVKELALNSFGKQNNAILTDINIDIPHKSFNIVIGPVGSGKTSLLDAILGEMELIKGSVNIDRDLKIAYAPQKPWIQNVTIRDNIIFDKSFDQEKYDKVVAACCLQRDFEILTLGDQTKAGENGANLSGGQKQRIGLARAVYQEADIYLLDDVLSALDVKVADHIFEQVLSSEKGLLKGQTRIFTTNNPALFTKADTIIQMDGGHIIGITSPSETKGTLEFIENLENISLNNDSAPGNNEYSKEKNYMPKENYSELNLDADEHSNIGITTYKNLIKLFPITWGVLLLFAVGTSLASSLTNQFLLIAWSNYNSLEAHQLITNNLTDNAHKVGTNYLTYYCVLETTTGLTLILIIYSLYRCIISACNTSHKKILSNVIYSPMIFFETTSIGRILNRFSGDIDTFDTLPPVFANFPMRYGIEVTVRMVPIIVAAPMFITLIIIIFIFLAIVTRYCLPLFRRIQSLALSSRSPFITHCRETIAGLPIIRSSQSEDFVLSKFFDKTDRNVNAVNSTRAIFNWQHFFIVIASNIFLASSFTLCYVLRHTLSPGQVGLIVTSIVTLIDRLSYLSHDISTAEARLVSVERILEYFKLKKESLDFALTESPKNWPYSGEIVFNHVSARYRPDLDLALSDLNLTLTPGSKVGIAGRTGSGKSTLTSVLFRLIEPSSGNILIDSVDTKHISLRQLRSKVAIVTQDPILFEGSIRFNMDPMSQYTDDDIWSSLEQAHMKKVVSSLTTGLDYNISSGGQSFSLGQRQLLCLAREIVRNCKIIVLDEATASIDHKTEEKIMETINQCEYKTRLIIAHRINTIENSDINVTLDHGKLINLQLKSADI